MDEQKKEPAADNETPANPGAAAKAQRPDPDATSAAEDAADEIDATLPIDESRFGGEHHIGADHAEPRNVTGTSNDNYIEGEYIDVGGGD